MRFLNALDQRPMRLFAGLLSVMVLALGLSVGGPASASHAVPMTKVCAPKKCITVPSSKVCTPAKGCKSAYREWPVGQYCAPSVGCFTYKGKNYSYVGGPKATAAEKLATQKCLASLGVTYLGAISTAPSTFGTSLVVLGVAVSLWGCS